MKKVLITLVLSAAFLSGCATIQPLPAQPENKLSVSTKTIEESDAVYVPKTNAQENSNTKSKQPITTPPQTTADPTEQPPTLAQPVIKAAPPAPEPTETVPADIPAADEQSAASAATAEEHTALSEHAVESVTTAQTMEDETTAEIPEAPTVPADTPTVTVSAKTGTEDITEPEPTPEPTPEPIQAADIGSAIAAAEAYAVEVYNVTIDYTLDFGNSGYRFPAVVPISASQETLNAKAVNMVEFTFQQMIQAYGKTLEQVRDANFRCHIYIQQSGNDLQTYVFYA